MAVATGRPTRNITIRKIGNSEGLILPKELLDRLNLKAGDNVIVVQEGQELRLRRLEDSAEEFERKMKIARERMKKYEVAYRALAK
ncbi:AbrB/MazE/SpoVT family DNA-binding domain-containing protein [Mesorhizobium sp. M1A.F.Ca.ET.072.01.1.1]|uniref:AbrB/MazE/SpoVT family DNA-binding domain-containing protein n=1 Tax=Mesorhizobium sp. M1A.F.Ca.ET.072.01.1.1 TaxID=2496753 RepID=UPI000FD39BEE|nr:AbrB/MazE/SpoVT family DNA-binding domain-containing protein [Mesorhizobium sp. M1A.F.Ca.ET.072.01.1.1]RUW52009.1 AbrB/MazE/SpoVT family DNA-binding domain-containing protein [Mesorhizobium sp. M1A.F.Ca.ET.072.01.1.1]TIU94963.1 MAG: AbrB/MazE/SpoVT family DNA-binding domain-containing protein [Mesorhizobium sp.]